MPGLPYLTRSCSVPPVKSLLSPLRRMPSKSVLPLCVTLNHTTPLEVMTRCPPPGAAVSAEAADGAAAGAAGACGLGAGALPSIQPRSTETSAEPVAAAPTAGCGAGTAAGAGGAGFSTDAVPPVWGLVETLVKLLLFCQVSHTAAQMDTITMAYI